jgi:uncharacterized protein
MADELNRLIARAEALLERAAALLPPRPECDWDAPALRWQVAPGGGGLAALRRVSAPTLDDLLGIEPQKAALIRNTRQFLAGLPANHALLWGSRGTGKSSLVKALVPAYAAQGLRLIELDPAHLADLPRIADCVAGRPERFVVYCDDLAFAAPGGAYQALKVALEGALGAPDGNLLVYATSNRRHLVPEYVEENARARRVGEEIHPGEAVEEKISLAERFGLWLAFHPFTQDQYLAAVAHWLARLGADPARDGVREAALRYALARGSRSGRVAHQFARDHAGRVRLGDGTGRP